MVDSSEYITWVKTHQMNPTPSLNDLYNAKMQSLSKYFEGAAEKADEAAKNLKMVTAVANKPKYLQGKTMTWEYLLDIEPEKKPYVVTNAEKVSSDPFYIAEGSIARQLRLADLQKAAKPVIQSDKYQTQQIKATDQAGNVSWFKTKEEFQKAAMELSEKSKWADGLEYVYAVKPEEVASVKEANIVISLVHGKDKTHAPVIDLDFDHVLQEHEGLFFLWVRDSSVNVDNLVEYLTDIELIDSSASQSLLEHNVVPLTFPFHYVPSSTPSHGHLYIEEELKDEDFWDMMEFMKDCKFIESGYYHASRARGYSALRLPWIKKDSNESPTSD